MARKIYYVVLIVVLLASARQGESAPDWLSNLNRDMNELNRNIQDNVNRFTQNLHSQLETSLQSTREEINRAIESIPRDSEGHVITNGVSYFGGNLISISANGATKKIVQSYTKDGESYVKVIEEHKDKKYLYHDEVDYNLKTNATERHRWRYDWTTPGAQIEILPNEE